MSGHTKGPVNIERARANIAELTSEGPWRTDDASPRDIIDNGGAGGGPGLVAQCETQQDADALCYLRNNASAWLDEIERLRAAIIRSRAATPARDEGAK